jgi:hypothetical protein
MLFQVLPTYSAKDLAIAQQQYLLLLLDSSQESFDPQELENQRNLQITVLVEGESATTHKLDL